MKSTHTFVTLDVSTAAYEEIKGKLEAANYQDQFFTDDGRMVIDMHGIALGRDPKDAPMPLPEHQPPSEFVPMPPDNPSPDDPSVPGLTRYPLPEPFVCGIDPQLSTSGQYHCPVCSNMVMGGFPHPPVDCDQGCHTLKVYLTPDHKAILCSIHYHAYCERVSPVPITQAELDAIDNPPGTETPAIPETPSLPETPSVLQGEAALEQSIALMDGKTPDGKTIRIYNKLVRDKMDEVIEADGNKAALRTVYGGELLALATQKLIEEMREYLESPNMGELVDLQETILCLTQFHGGQEHFHSLAEGKRNLRGGLTRGLVLIWTEH